MNTFKSYFLKELLEAFRQFRVLILGVLAMFLAITDPIILYFTPRIIESQFDGQGFDFSKLIQTNQIAAIREFLGNAYQIIGIVIIVLGFKLVINEFKTRTIIIPYTNGSNNSTMLLAKYIVYVLWVNIILCTAIILNHIYSGLVFGDFTANFMFTFHAMVSLIVFIDFNVSIMFFLSALTNNGIVVVAGTLFNYLVLPSLLNMFKFLKYTPYRLLESLSLTPFNNVARYSIALTIFSIILILLLAMIRIRKFELK